jgi:hypothetical protein
MADRGREGGIIYNMGGLVYRVLDKDGNKTGVPIKASSIYNKPTLSFLEKKFGENEKLKQEYKRNLKTSIDWVMIKPLRNISAFKEALAKEKISLVIRQNEDGIIYGLTYIDHNTKCVFNGSDIGKDYSAKRILEKCGTAPIVTINEKAEKHKVKPAETILPGQQTHNDGSSVFPTPLEIIVTPIEQNYYLPWELRKQKRKKRKSK